MRSACLASTCAAVYRSAYCRELLRERLFETSVENALEELHLFERYAQSTPTEWVDQLQSCNSLSHKVAQLIDKVDEWYFRERASAKVSLSEPALWYPKARHMRRSFHFHHGPTNSGKTHDALRALTAAKSGIYCAPLKALASQVCEIINRRRVPCDLLIGDERAFAGSAEHVSCTVEMTPIDRSVDVAVIDEVQLIGDRDRGWAWTRALLGVPAREIHLCGEARTIEIVRGVLRSSREETRLRLAAHHRLVPLRVSTSLGGDISRVENGDCFVCFSKKSAFDLCKKLEDQPGVAVHLVYGAMPYAVREASCRAFNAGTSRGHTALEKHVLVSTDAIAYGLNMNIRRVIFTTTRKFDGREHVHLSKSALRQIGGRAGRFGLQFADEGLVTSLHDRDFGLVSTAFAGTCNPSSPSLVDDEPVARAGLLPNAEQLMAFAELQRRRGVASGSSLAELLRQFTSSSGAAPSRLFFLCDMSRSLVALAVALDSVVGLSLRDKIVFCFVPLSDSKPESLALIQSYAAAHATGGPARLGLSADELLLHRPQSSNVVDRLEWAYRMCEAYCWLAWRFRRSFADMEAGQEMKKFITEHLKMLLNGRRQH